MASISPNDYSTLSNPHLQLRITNQLAPADTLTMTFQSCTHFLLLSLTILTIEWNRFIFIVQTQQPSGCRTLKMQDKKVKKLTNSQPSMKRIRNEMGMDTNFALLIPLSILLIHSIPYQFSYSH